MHTICCTFQPGKPGRSNPIKSRKAIKRLNRRHVNGKPRSLFRETQREKRGGGSLKERRRRALDGGAPRTAVLPLEDLYTSPAFPSHRVAFIRLGGKSSPIKVMGNSGYRQRSQRVLHFARCGRWRGRGERDACGGRGGKANDYHYRLVYPLRCRAVRTALDFAFTVRKDSPRDREERRALHFRQERTAVNW